MSLAAGARLGHYSIVSPIGAGGMGAVYRAHDPRLGRDVAIKVLPAAFSDDPERLRRFEQEARAAGALSHPNILVIHDVEISDRAVRGRGTDAPVCFVVMELLEGATLRDELDGSPLPVRKAVDYALQITRGLTAAHEKGIVHRDLKPENLFATSDGHIKILDFGIAKLRAGEGSNAGGLGQTAVATQQATDPGLVIGSVGYMSPEQVRGAAVDHRSDLFSFGVVLYEMLTGRRAFSGESAVETLNAILKDTPPDVSEHTGGGTRIAPALDKIIARCLEKKPERRFQSASDLGFALEALTEGSGPQQAVAPHTATDSSGASSRGSLRRNWLIAAVVAALAIAAGLGWMALPRRPAPVDPLTMRLTITGPEDATDLLTPMVSPDGRYVAFSARIADGGPVPAIWLRALDAVTPRRLPGTDGAVGSVIWSPDSRSFVFPSLGATLKRIDLAGGPPRIVSKMATPNVVSFGDVGGSWSRDGTILFNVAGTAFRVPAAGGEPTRIDTQGIDCRSPLFLPDGRHFLCLALTGQPETSGIHLASLDGGPSRRLLAAASQAVYVESRTDQGSLLFIRENTLLAQPFDARTFELTGEPKRVADRVRLFVDGYKNSGRGHFSVSDAGVLVYLAGEDDRQQLTALDRTGKPIATIGDADLYFSSRLSPDDRRLAVARIDATTRAGDIHVIDPGAGTSVRLTFNPADDFNPVWSPDGRYIVWGADRGGKYQLLRKLATGVGPEELLREGSTAMAPDDWSPDGRLILYREFSPHTNNDLWLLPLDGDRKPFPFLQTTADEPRARFSPDGHLIGYITNEFGSFDTYVQTFPASGSKWQVSPSGGSSVSWRTDGKELYYLGNGKLWAVAVKRASPFEMGGRRALFDQPSIPLRSYFAASGDGQRFVFAVNTAQRRQAPVYTVVFNWAAEIETAR